MADTVEPSLEPFAVEAQVILERLCRQPSVAAQGLGMEEMAGLMEAELRDAGFSTRRFSGADAPPIIYGEQRGRGPFTLLLYNHYDVQPPEPLELWESPPFEPTVRNGKLYARGAADNKGELAARLAAVRALRATDGEPPITIKWIVEGEEEVAIPGFYDAVLPPTPAELATYVDRPDVDAQRLAMFGLEHFLDDLTGSALWKRASFAPTANIAGLGSGYTGEGTKTVLPAKALAKLDFRLVPDQAPQAIVAALRAHLDARGYGDVQMKILAAAEPDKTPLTDSRLDEHTVTVRRAPSASSYSRRRRRANSASRA